MPVDTMFSEYDTFFIIHVGINDLIRTHLDKVAQNIESMIVKVKSQAKQVAASTVVRRYDNKQAGNLPEHARLK